MRILSILSLMIVIFISSCSEPETKTEAPADISPAIKKFDPELVSHFPDNKNFQLLSYHYYYPESSAASHKGAWLRARYMVTHEIVDSLVNIYSAETQTVCYPETPCNLLIPARDTSSGSIAKAEILDCDEGDELTPVPSFTDELQDMKLHMLKRLPKSYILYVLDAESGKYLPDDQLLEDGIMPAGWEHGKSKGVAVNPGKYELIYWVEIW